MEKFKMARGKPCYLKRRNVTYPTKDTFLQRIKEIRDSHISNRRCHIENPEYIADLKDFLEDFYSDVERILSKHDFDNCKFFVQKSPNYSTSCIYIESNGVADDVSTSKFNPPSKKAKFSQACSYILIPKKREIKRQKFKESDLIGDLNNYELIHQNPSWGEIVDQFILKKNLSEILGDVISDDTQGNNAPVFRDKYSNLNQEFLDFYDSLDLKYELKG